MRKAWLTGAAIIALTIASGSARAAGLFENGDWNFGSANVAATQNALAMEQMRQQKDGGQYNQTTPVTNLQVETFSQTSQSIGNLNQVTINNSSNVSVGSSQSNSHSTQTSQASTGGGTTMGTDLNGTLTIRPLNGQ